uniref:Uncharacterized protein n=1 Tax=Anguilla anguilla TaxID=7936 RepID=A0A0E9WAS9_ANGAN
MYVINQDFNQSANKTWKPPTCFVTLDFN